MAKQKLVGTAEQSRAFVGLTSFSTKLYSGNINFSFDATQANFFNGIFRRSSKRNFILKRAWVQLSCSINYNLLSLKV